MITNRLKINNNRFVSKKSISQFCIYKNNKYINIFIPGRITCNDFIKKLLDILESDIYIWNDCIYSTNYNLEEYIICNNIIERLRLNDYKNNYRLYHFINFEDRKNIIKYILDLPEYLYNLDNLEDNLYKLYEELILDDNINYLYKYMELNNYKLMNIIWFNICRYNKIDILIYMLDDYDIGFSDLCYLIADINKNDDIIYILKKSYICIDDNYDDNDIIDNYGDILDDKYSIQLFSNSSI